MFEPQDHPDDFLYEGGPPVPPYDSAGWTLAFQMGVEFDRILEGFDGPFEKIEGLAKPPPGKVSQGGGAAGFLLSHAPNDAVVATNRLLASDHEVYWLTEPISANGKTYPSERYTFQAKPTTGKMLEKMASELGLSFDGVKTAPSEYALQLHPVRIGLWDRYGGSMPSGWTRWLFEQFEFPFEVVYAQNSRCRQLEQQVRCPRLRHRRHPTRQGQHGSACWFSRRNLNRIRNRFRPSTEVGLEGSLQTRPCPNSSSFSKQVAPSSPSAAQRIWDPWQVFPWEITWSTEKEIRYRMISTTSRDRCFRFVLTIRIPLLTE